LKNGISFSGKPSSGLKKRMIADIIGQIFWFGMLATPLISLLIVRRLSLTTGSKILLGIAITLILAVVFYCIALGIVTRDGLGN
jgi:hypothetical protein